MLYVTHSGLGAKTEGYVPRDLMSLVDRIAQQVRRDFMFELTDD